MNYVIQHSKVVFQFWNVEIFAKNGTTHLLQVFCEFLIISGLNSEIFHGNHKCHEILAKSLIHFPNQKIASLEVYLLEHRFW